VTGSVTSIGVVYPRSLDSADIARHLVAVLGPVLGNRHVGRWALRLSGGGEQAPWVETTVSDSDDPATLLALLGHFFVAEYAEMDVSISLPGIGIVDGVLRPEPALNGLLLDLPDAMLFPERAPNRSETVTAAIRELLLAWYDLSRFDCAFADHEAEFDIDPKSTEFGTGHYAMVALPVEAAKGPPLRFREAAWRLSPMGG